MRLKHFWLVCLAAVILPATGVFGASPYFIDFAGGSDGNPGTKAQPWKHHPYQVGWSGSYGHVAGDRFYFKGGVTWPLSCFPMVIPAGGSSTTRDYYGVDLTWPSSGWTRPTFDFADSNPGTAVNVGGNFVTIDNIRFYNYAIHPFTTNSSSGIVVATNGNASATTVTVQNCLFQDYANVTCCFATNTGIELTGNEFTQQGRIAVGTDNVSRIPFAQAVNGVPYFTYNHVHHISSVMNYCSGIEYAHNHVHDSYKPYRANSNVTDGAHCNAFQIGRPCSVHDNLIHDLDGQMSPLSINPNFSGQNAGTSLTYNNHIYNAPQAWGVTTDSGGSGYFNCNGIDVYFYNNTGANDGSYQVNAALRVPSDKFKSIHAQNNLHIGTGSIVIVNAVVSGGAFVNTPNLSLPSGAAYFVNGIPSDGSAPTINTGVSTPSSIFTTDILGATRVLWDIGAYEFGGVISPTPTPTATGSPTATPTATATPTPTPTATPTPTPPLLTGLGPFNPIQGRVTAPFVPLGNNVAQSSQTVDPTLGGEMTFRFTAPVAGLYTVSASVNCPSDASNSFFIDIDQQPATPTAIWDVVLFTNNFETRTASWRGDGGFDSPQFAPKYFGPFNAGTVHQLVIRGREANAILGPITINSPTPTPTPVPTPTPTPWPTPTPTPTATPTPTPPPLPFIPSAPSPAVGTIDVSVTPSLTWNGDGDTYDVKLGTTNPPPQVAAGVLSASYTHPSALSYSTPYFWQVVSHNANGMTTGPVWSFTTVDAPVPSFPVVSIDTPASGTIYTSAPATVSITATATDSDGTVANVKFYSGADLLNTDSTSPFAFSWTSVPAGNYTLTAVATDNGGNQSQASAPVFIQVVPAESVLIPFKVIYIAH